MSFKQLFFIGVVLGFFLSGCGHSPIIPEEFTPHIQKWENTHGDLQRIERIALGTPDPSAQVLGVCFTEAGSIIIQTTFWNLASYNEREEVLFHELGHCELGRSHVIAYIEDPWPHPKSIMYPYAIREYVYLSFYGHYQLELTQN